MKEIPLTRGKVALVDDEDYEWLSQWKWYARKNGTNWHALRKAPHPVIGWRGQVKVWMHREIINTPEGLITDHINGNGLDNRKENLRAVTPAQNMMNRKTNTNNRLGVRGVRQSGKKFRASISVDGNTIHFPTRATLVEAIDDRVAAEIKYFGEYRRK